jgi:hypothetical protein
MTQESERVTANVLKQHVESRIGNPAEYVGYGPLSAPILKKIELEFDTILGHATSVAKHQGESSMPLLSMHQNDVRQFLRYSRQDPGSPVLPYHGLTLETQTLFKLLYDAGFTLEQQYSGPRQVYWEDKGPQLLIVRW